nr:molybdopterin-dependent oxidoreductase [Klebsiella pneumoniae subsp. pneumoniae]
MESRTTGRRQDVELKLSLLDIRDSVVSVSFPTLAATKTRIFRSVAQSPVTLHPLPAKQLTLASGESGLVVSVYDLILANYGLDRGFDDVNAAKDFAEVKAYTPAWAEQITGVPRQHIEQIAREFADTAHKTHGRSMIILGAGVNHWYHMDMNYRGMINLQVFCGCVGQSGGGWSHYVGQEKLRPQTGWLPLAFAGLESSAAADEQYLLFLQPRQPVALRKLTAQELLSPLADASKFSGSLIDFNVRAERMGWLPSAPQLNVNPLTIKQQAEAAGLSPRSSPSSR